MEVWHDNDNGDERSGWVLVFLALVAIVFLVLVIWGIIAALAAIIPG